MNLKQNRAVTLISLTVTIVVLIIIAGITVSTSVISIEKAKLQELRTNMLLIQAKAKEVLEEANFKMGPNPEEKKIAVREEVYQTEAKLEKVNSSSIPGLDTENLYKVTTETLKLWGLNKIELKKDEEYLIKFTDIVANEGKITVEIYSTKGFESNGITKYSLTDIDQIN